VDAELNEYEFDDCKRRNFGAEHTIVLWFRRTWGWAATQRIQHGQSIALSAATSNSADLGFYQCSQPASNES